MNGRQAILAVASAAALVLPSAVGAAGAGHVAGNYTVKSSGTSKCRPVGSSITTVRCDTSGFVSRYSGSLTGTSTTNFTQLIDCKTGRTHGQGTEVFTGSVAGLGSGKLTWHIQFQGKFQQPYCKSQALATFSGKGLGAAGKGALGAVHGQLAFTLTTYDGTLR